MRRAIWILTLALPLVITGCGITGKWSLATVEPTAARRDFEYTSLTLQSDDTYYAERQTPTGTETDSGTYKYRDGSLVLESHTGERTSYDAQLKGNRLELERFWRDRKLTAEFERGKD